MLPLSPVARLHIALRTTPARLGGRHGADPAQNLLDQGRKSKSKDSEIRLCKQRARTDVRLLPHATARRCRGEGGALSVGKPDIMVCGAFAAGGAGLGDAVGGGAVRSRSNAPKILPVAAAPPGCRAGSLARGASAWVQKCNDPRLW